jgi:hypothetical protein
MDLMARRKREAKSTPNPVTTEQLGHGRQIPIKHRRERKANLNQLGVAMGNDPHGKEFY